MNFNTLFFIILFLPMGILFFYLLRKINQKASMIFLLIYSIIFYYLLEKNLFILIGIIILNYLLAECIFKYTKYRKICLYIAVVINIGTLLFYKYFPVWFGNKVPYLNAVILPIGLSFIIFQLLSYIIDIYQNKIKRENNSLIDLLGYILFFPKIMQGPIGRYNEFQSKNSGGGYIYAME